MKQISLCLMEMHDGETCIMVALQLYRVEIYSFQLTQLLHLLRPFTQIVYTIIRWHSIVSSCLIHIFYTNLLFSRVTIYLPSKASVLKILINLFFLKILFLTEYPVIITEAQLRGTKSELYWF